MNRCRLPNEIFQASDAPSIVDSVKFTGRQLSALRRGFVNCVFGFGKRNDWDLDASILCRPDKAGQ
jgi:hypothetical protein